MSDSAVIETVEVTDDLDAFSDLMFNPDSKPVEKVEEKEVKEPEVVTEAAEPSDPPSADVGKEGDESEPKDPSDEEDDLEKVDEEDDEKDESLFKVKPRKSAKERIQELTRQREDERRRADALARELEESRAKKVEEKPKAPAPVDKLDGPNPEETLEDGTPKYPLGEFDPLYIRDLTRYTIHHEKQAIDRADAEKKELERVKNAERELTDSWNAKVKTAVEELPDLPGKAVGLEGEFRSLDPQYGNYLAQTIMSLEYGPQVLNYLADNIDEARKIVAAGPTRATIALGRLEARFASTPSDTPPKEVKTAAPPPPPRTRGSGGNVGVQPDTDDLDAFEKIYFAKK